MNETPERANAHAEARAELVCREVREDIVALQRDELSPLRAESVRLHLASCAECREEALELELAVRDCAKLAEVVPPPDLVDLTMRRVREAHGCPDGAPAGPAEVSVRPPAALRTGGRAEPVASRPAPAPAADRPSILRRPVRNPLVRVAVAALLFVAVLVLATEHAAEAAARVQRGLLGVRISAAFDEARERLLTRLRM